VIRATTAARATEVFAALAVIWILFAALRWFLHAAKWFFAVAIIANPAVHRREYSRKSSASRSISTASSGRSARMPAQRGTFSQGSHTRTASRSNQPPLLPLMNSAAITRSAVMPELEPESFLFPAARK